MLQQVEAPVLPSRGEPSKLTSSHTTPKRGHDDSLASNMNGINTDKFRLVSYRERLTFYYISGVGSLLGKSDLMNDKGPWNTDWPPWFIINPSVCRPKPGRKAVRQSTHLRPPGLFP